MDNEIFDANLLTYAEVFNTIMAPLGDRAPRLRLLTVDYKNRDGVDCCQDIAFTQTSDVTDQRLVEIVMEQYAGLGFTVSAVTEIIMTDAGLLPNFLYIRPEFLSECMKGGGRQ